MSLVLDAGAFIALERNDRALWRRFDDAHLEDSPPLTHGGVVAQVWRGGSGRQVRLAKALLGTVVVPLDNDLGRRAGVLLARAGLVDAIDAALIALCRPGDQIVTSDPADIDTLAEVAGLRVDVIPA